MILLLAGTTEAKLLALEMKKAGYSFLANVADESALGEYAAADVPAQFMRLTAEEMAALIQTRKIHTVVDATHPYAREATENAIRAGRTTGARYIRYERPHSRDLSNWRKSGFYHETKDYSQAAHKIIELAKKRVAKKTCVMLTTGSKNLSEITSPLFGNDIEVVARVLPRTQSVAQCEKAGIIQRNIIAMQGPFSGQLNNLLYDKYGVDILVTKESGAEGSVLEKVETALARSMDVVMIMRPEINESAGSGNGVCIMNTIEGVMKRLGEIILNNE